MLLERSGGGRVSDGSCWGGQEVGEKVTGAAGAVRGGRVSDGSCWSGQEVGV